MVPIGRFAAVLWDFGGVVTSSPFEAFRRYEERNALPTDFIRGVNATNPHGNAWAQLERNDITADAFDELFAAESASLGFRVQGRDMLALLQGEVRPEMVAAIDRVRREGYATACLTNNVAGPGGRPAEIESVMARFDAVVESSKVGVRKPETRFYEIACERIGVEARRCIFLDDLGVNLKPAAAMGMTTIKVVDPAAALASLFAALDLPAH